MEPTNWNLSLNDRRIFNSAGLIVLALFLSATRVFAQGHGGPARVELASAEERWIAPTIRLVGSILPQRRSLIAAEVEGMVDGLPVDIGDRVAKGDLICKFRDTPQRFARDEAVARVAELEAAVRVVQADLKRWEYEHKRMARLLEMGQGAEKESIDAAANFESGKARVSQAEASLRAAQAVLGRIEDELEHTEVRAPFDGFVVAKLTEVGSWVTKGGGVVELIDLSTARVRMNVPESCIAYNGVGVEATVGVDALNRMFAGKVARVVPDADMQARTFPVDVDIPNPDGLLKSGMFARGNVPSGPTDRRLVVPKNAIVTRGPVNYLFVVRKHADGNVADMLSVKVVSEVLDAVAVEAEGLAAGDSVVIRGNESMYGPGPVMIMPSSVKTDGEKMTSTPAPLATQPAEGHTVGAEPISSHQEIPPEGAEPSQSEK